MILLNSTSADPKEHGQKYMSSMVAKFVSFELHIALSRVDGCCEHDKLPTFVKQDFNGAYF